MEFRELIGRLRRPPQIEAKGAYSDKNVIQALRTCDWFTPDYIEEVIESEPMSESEGLGPYKDRLLQEFFGTAYDLNKVSKVYREVRRYLYNLMVVSEGFPRPLNEIPFVDEEIRELAKKLGVEDKYEVDRSYIGEIDPMLQCIIAPEKMRRNVVRVLCSWGSEETRRDRLLWSQLVGKGVKSWLARKK